MSLHGEVQIARRSAKADCGDMTLAIYSRQDMINISFLLI